MNTIHVTIAQGWFVGTFAIAIAAVLAAASFAVDDTASKKAAQFRDNMRKQLDTVERRLKSVQANLRAESEQAEKSLREKLDEARRELRAQKERVEQTQATLKARAQEKLTETEGAVSEWKAKRETYKLNARADRAEAYAAAAIDHAAAAINEAEEAILDAAVARIDAAQPSATAR